MTHVNILSGGAAQGLVGSLAPKFKALTGLDIEGEFGAVGAMADKLRAGTPTDIVILTAAMIAKLATREARGAASIIGCRAGRDRDGGPRPAIRWSRSAMPRHCARRSSPRTRSSFPIPRHQRPGFTSRKCCSNWALPTRSRPGSRSIRMAQPPCAIWRRPMPARPIGCTQSTEIISTEGVVLSGSLPPGCELSTMYTAAVHHAAPPHASTGAGLIDLLIGADQREAAQPRGLSRRAQK